MGSNGFLGGGNWGAGDGSGSDDRTGFFDLEVVAVGGGGVGADVDAEYDRITGI